MIKKLEELTNSAVLKGKKRLVVAYANDVHTIEAVHKAVELGLVSATLIGDRSIIEHICQEHGINSNSFAIIQEETDTKCVSRAITMINAGEVDLLMKGLVSTDKYMKGILAKEGGLVAGKGVLSHVTVLELPVYHKLLIITDVAVIPAPDITQKAALVRYVIQVAHSLGNVAPKVALIAPTEQVLPKIESCADAAILAKMADRGQLTGGTVDGPLSLDVALDKETAQIKKVSSPVAGDADCLVFPNIESANVFFKTATKLCHAELAAFVIGAKVPCILTSRGDTMRSKLYSIALAALSA